MHADADDEARVAQQRVLDLRQPVARIVGVEALVDHHLLAVVRPALGVAWQRRSTLRMSDGKFFA